MNAQVRCLPLTYTLTNTVQTMQPPPLSLRVRDLPARVEVFHKHGGLLPDAGRPAADARRSLPVPRLAGPPGCHHLPTRADAVLHLVSRHTCITASSQQADKWPHPAPNSAPPTDI